jgi:phospholipase/lecithinase/hemolysin
VGNVQGFQKAGEMEAVKKFKELEAAGAASTMKGARHAPKTVYVFGDSLSDTGNSYLRYSSLWPWAFSPPYAVPRLSNGPIWPDYLGVAIGTTISPVVYGGTNYSLVGATISPENYLSFDPYATGFAMVDRFLAGNGSADPRAIYVVWLGGNDIDPPDTFTEWNFEQLAVMVGRLHAAGARNFLIPNVMDIGKLPVIIGLGDPTYAQQLSEMTVLFNQLVAGLPARFPDSKIQIADVYRLRSLIDRYPKVFGFTNTTESCYKAVALGGDGSVCPRPDQYWFWDHAHPTTRGHKLLSSLLVLELLKAGELKASDLGARRA